MKRLLAIVMVLGLMTGTVTVAEAAKSKKPVKTTLHLHGSYPLGEIDGIDWFANGTPPMAMDPNKPTEQIPRSMNFNTPGLNTNCTGLPLGFPTWVGNINGTIVGNAILTLHTIAGPARLTARLWVDTPVFSCNEAYVAPHSEVIVDVPPGSNEVKIKFPKLRLRATSLVMIEVLGGGAPRGRVLYDATSAPSSLAFGCLPARGKSCA